MPLPGEALQPHRDRPLSVDGSAVRHRGSTLAWRLGAPVVLGLVALLVYLRTLAPSIVWGDSPELTTAAYLAGVPHPTGYPLYMLLAHAFLRLWPEGTIAFRMNLLAALTAAGAVIFIYVLMRQVVRSRPASVAGALVYAFSTTFWSQAIIAEHYAFAMLLMAAVLSSVILWDRTGERRWLFSAAFLYGLCLTHHMMGLLLAPALLFFAFSSAQRGQFVRELPRTLPLFLLPLSLYLYLPIAAFRDPPTNWGDPRTWDRFIAHVTGRQYRFVMFHLTARELWSQVKEYAGLGLDAPPGYLVAQFGLPWLGLAPIGAWSLARRRRRLFGLTLLVYGADVLYATNYYVYNGAIYYLPSHLMVALWIGCGLREMTAGFSLLGRRLRIQPMRRRPMKAVLGCGLLLLPAMLVTSHWAQNDRHHDWDTLAYAHAALETLKPHALVLCEGDTTYFPLLYARYVEQCRPDTTLLELADLVTPSHLRLVTRRRRDGLRLELSPQLQREWAAGRADHTALLSQLLAENVGRRPVYLVSTTGLLRRRWLINALAPYYQITDSNLSRLELCPAPPQLAATSAPVLHAQPTRFVAVHFGSGGKYSLDLLDCDPQPVRLRDVHLIRLRYRWRVNDIAAARRATVWAMFTDQNGDYRRNEDGSPELANIHPLAYGLARRLSRLPNSLVETYTLYVPPGEWRRHLCLRVAVAVDNRFLPVAAQRSPWVEVGQVSVPATLEQSGSPPTVAAPAPSIQISRVSDPALRGR